MEEQYLKKFQDVKIAFTDIIYSFIKQSKLYFLILVFVIIISTILSVLAPYIFSMVINEISDKKYL